MILHSHFIKRGKRYRLPSHRLRSRLHIKLNYMISNRRCSASVHPKTMWEGAYYFLKESISLFRTTSDSPLSVFNTTIFQSCFVSRALPSSLVCPLESRLPLCALRFNFFQQLRKHLCLSVLLTFLLIRIVSRFGYHFLGHRFLRL